MKLKESITICSSSVTKILYMVRNPYYEFCSLAIGTVCNVKYIIAVEIKLKTQKYIYKSCTGVLFCVANNWFRGLIKYF